ncbi:regulator of G-protein signaling 12 isoform X2 [Betta splendens]|uniref:Regulator of G-protein signaling 12 isoform X2 n=1 Tax=Betta splendens TaxID=158456 RepID=A0A6P7L294_BETSP|nr:regulator of G-protein signaling 12 isoform X2 [Betta splendens]
MRIQGQPEGVRRRLDLNVAGELRSVEVIRGRSGYGFTIAGQRPCMMRGILKGSPADLVGLKQGDRIMAISGTDVSTAPHDTVVQLIGSCKGPLRLVVHTEGRIMGNPILHDAKFGVCQKNGIFEKAAVLRTVSDDSSNSSINSSHGVSARQRPVSEPDMSQWSQQWSSLAEQPKEETSRIRGVNCTFAGTEELSPSWSVLNMTMVVGYLSSTELILNTRESEEDCLRAIRERIRQLGTEQNTHTLVIMKIMFDCIRLCDDTGAVLAAFPAENLVLGAVCAEDPRFFCLVTTAHIINGRVPADSPLRASCHVFFIDPELGNHEDHIGIAGRFGFDCTPDPDSLGCLEFPQTPPDVLHFVTVLYSDMGETVERLRVKLDLEAQQQAKENGSTGKQGSASSNADSGIGNASPPEERADRDFPSAIQNHPGAHLPSCPWDYPPDEDLSPINLLKNDHKPKTENHISTHSLSESLPGPDSLTSFYGGPPPRLEFQFKPPPPPLPLSKKPNFFADPLRSSQRWFSKSRWPKALSGDAEPQVMSNNDWLPGVSLSASTNNLPPPMTQIPSDRYQSAEVIMLPPKEEWTKRFLEQREKQRKDGGGRNSSRFWGIGGIRTSKRRSAKRLSMARSLDDLESAASSDGDYSGVQLQGCCSQSSLNSNGSLPGTGSHRGAPEQRVASWAACFERLLQDPVGVRYFSEFLKKEFSEENILFWQACEYFSHVPATDKKQLSQRAGEIYNSFLSSKATMPVNIDSQAQLADDVLTSPQPDMFKTQQLQIFNLMKFDSYSRFLKSSLYQECVRAEVDGQPLPDPYQIPCSPAPSKHSASSDRSTLSTPKKEARKQRSGRSLNEETKDESADKKRGIFFSWSRNRSFGKGPKKKEIGDINLDYWGSNGRRESQGSLSSGTSLEMATSCSTGKIESDNRHSLGAWERTPKHCSVILPDGSCSSVTLRPGASIREVLQDLCHNISVNIAAVDLFLVGGEKPLVLDQDCMTLSARDLRLEKRTLFRLDLVPINRSVGLKAKPTKPVTEVLRPVVAKYGLHLSELVAKISGETEPLDLGAPISSLDGLRVVLERADPASVKDKSKSSSLKGHPPTRSLSAAGDERSTPKDFSVRASGPDSAFPVEKRKQKKINIDEAEEFFELLSRAQSSRANDQRGLLSKEDLVLPDFLRLTPPTSSFSVSSNLACSTPDSLRQNRENGVPSRGPLTSSLRSESLDSSLSSSANGHSGTRRCLMPPPRHPTFGTHLSPISRPLDTRPSLRTVEEDAHTDLTLVGEGDISSPNSTLLPPSPSPMPPFDSSLPEANFTPPPPCSMSPDAGEEGKSTSEGKPRASPPEPAAGPGAAAAAAPVQEVTDVEGVHLEEGAHEAPRGEDPELSLSFHGYVAELRQCQSRMRNAQGPQNGRNPPEGQDCNTELFKATIV